MSLTMSAIYFGAAAVLIFAACILSAKKIQHRHLPPKRIFLIALLSLAAMALIWLLLVLLSRPREKSRPQLLDHSIETTLPTNSAPGATESTGAASMEMISPWRLPWSVLRATSSPT
jgi:hypothetical protein